MKKLITVLLLFISASSFSQRIFNNITFTRNANFEGRTTISDTDFTIINGIDSLKFNIENDTCYVTANVSYFKFSPTATNITGSSSPDTSAAASHIATQNMVRLTDSINGKPALINSISNLPGTGIGVYKTVTATDAKFKRLKGGTNITITDNTDSITITGPTVTDGVNGTDGASSLDWHFISGGGTDLEPGSAAFTFNTTDFGTLTNINISQFEGNGSENVMGYFPAIHAGDIITMIQKGTPEYFAVYRISSVIRYPDGLTHLYASFNVEFLASASSPAEFDNTNICSISFDRGVGMTKKLETVIQAGHTIHNLINDCLPVTFTYTDNADGTLTIEASDDVFTNETTVTISTNTSFPNLTYSGSYVDGSHYIISSYDALNSALDPNGITASNIKILIETPR